MVYYVVEVSITQFGRVPDCGSGSSRFEAEYLPFLWTIKNTKYTKQLDKRLILTLSLLQVLHRSFLVPNFYNFVCSKLVLFFSSKTYYSSNKTLHKNTKSLLVLPHYLLTNQNLETQKAQNTSNLKKYKSLFLLFTNINTSLVNRVLAPHFSFVSLYQYNRQSNVGYFNFRKVFNVWLTLINFLVNFFFYKITFLSFTSSYFKYENLSLNWSMNKTVRNLWKYSNPFLFFLSNKTTLENEAYFDLVKKKGFNASILIDIYYHKRTLHYLNKYKFITIGPVPMSSNFYSLTMSFPVASNSVFSNLFFIRLLFKFQKFAANSDFINYSIKHSNYHKQG